MKFKTLIILALTLVLLVTVAVPVSAARPTQKIKYAHKSDCGLTSSGVLSGSETSAYTVVGDRTSDTGERMVIKFRLGGINLNRMDSAELQLSFTRSLIDNSNWDVTAPFDNPGSGLGYTEVIHIADYGRRASSAAYNSSSIGNDPGMLLAAGASASRTESIDVTDAVIQAKTAKYHFVTFRIQTQNETDGDGMMDKWYINTSEISLANYRPTLVIHLLP